METSLPTPMINLPEGKPFYSLCSTMVSTLVSHGKTHMVSARWSGLLGVSLRGVHGVHRTVGTGGVAAKLPEFKNETLLQGKAIK